MSEFMSVEEKEEWFYKNLYWLKKWIKNAVPVENDVNMQDFVEHVNDGVKALELRILKQAVFGVKSTIITNGYKTVFLSGFLEMCGRLPNESDNVLIEYRRNMWFVLSKPWLIQSKCRFLFPKED